MRLSTLGRRQLCVQESSLLEQHQEEEPKFYVFVGLVMRTADCKGVAVVVSRFGAQVQTAREPTTNKPNPSSFTFKTPTE